MSDPRNVERDPNAPRNRPVGRQSSGITNSSWIIAAVIVVILGGLAAYSYRGTPMSSETTPPTTSGQGMRAPVPATPPAAPVVPAPRTQSQ
jgi:hypothetical protein